jgi:hypothetical protein
MGVSGPTTAIAENWRRPSRADRSRPGIWPVEPGAGTPEAVSSRRYQAVAVISGHVASIYLAYASLVPAMYLSGQETRLTCRYSGQEGRRTRPSSGRSRGDLPSKASAGTRRVCGPTRGPRKVNRAEARTRSPSPRHVIPARMPQAEHRAYERVGDPHPLCPPARQPSRFPELPPQSSHTTPSRAPALPESPQVRGRTHRDARSTPPCTSSLTRPPARPVRGRPWPSVEKPTVRTDRPGARTPSAIRPWTPRHSAPQRDKVIRHGTEKKRPAWPRIPS